MIEVMITVDEGCEDIGLPSYATEHAAGMDVKAAVTEDVAIEPFQIKLIPTGIKVAVPVGYEMQVRPRSGLALKHGIIVVNSPGTIDADYRGPVGVILGNMGHLPFVVKRGDRIAQLVLAKHETVQFKQATVLPETKRGEGGFGSTGMTSSK